MFSMPACSSKMTDECEQIWASKVFDKEGKTIISSKVPHVRSSKSVKEMNARNRIRSCTVKLFDHVMRHPSQAVEIWASVDSEELVSKSPAKSPLVQTDARDLFESVTTMGKLSHTAKAQVLSAMPNGPSADLLNRMHDRDSRAIHDVFYLVFRYGPQDRVPEKARSTVIFILMSKSRLAEVGFDIGEWFQASVDEDTGAVDWTVLPLYDFRWVGGRLHEIIHTRREPVIAAVPLRLSIPEGTPLNDFLLDDGAFFEWGDEKHQVYTWFARGTGPHEFRLDKVGTHLGHMADACRAEVENRVNAARALTDVASETVVLDQRVKRQRAQALENARKMRHASSGRVYQMPAPAAIEDGEDEETLEAAVVAEITAGDDVD